MNSLRDVFLYCTRGSGWAAGRISKYPWCDIVWYHVRAAVLNIIRRSPAMWGLWWRYWFEPVNAVLKTEHVVCPACFFMHLVTGTQPRYEMDGTEQVLVRSKVCVKLYTYADQVLKILKKVRP